MMAKLTVYATIDKCAGDGGAWLLNIWDGDGDMTEFYDARTTLAEAKRRAVKAINNEWSLDRKRLPWQQDNEHRYSCEIEIDRSY